MASFGKIIGLWKMSCLDNVLKQNHNGFQSASKGEFINGFDKTSFQCQNFTFWETTIEHKNQTKPLTFCSGINVVECSILLYAID